MAKNFKNLREELKDKGLVFTLGRFQPPHLGHALVISKMNEIANERGYDCVVFTTFTHNEDNPLFWEDKMNVLKDYFPSTKIVYVEDSVKDILKYAETEGYKYLVMVVGEDRVDNFKKLKNVEVISAGKRSKYSKTVTGISSTKMRNYAKKDDFKNFKKWLPDYRSSEAPQKLFDLVKKGIQMKRNKLKEDFKLGMFVKNEQGEIGKVVSIREHEVVYNVIKTGLMNVEKFDKLIVEDSPSNKLKYISEDKGIDYSILEDVYKKGQDAWNREQHAEWTPQELGFACVDIYISGLNEEVNELVEKELFTENKGSKKKKGSFKTFKATEGKVPLPTNTVNDPAFTGTTTAYVKEEELPKNPEIVRWALKESTQKKYKQKYGEKAKSKLIDDAKQINNSLKASVSGKTMTGKELQKVDMTPEISMGITGLSKTSGKPK